MNSVARKAFEEYNSAECTVHHGGRNAAPFWNYNSSQFTYVPSFYFPKSALAVSYRFTARDVQGNSHSFEADKPTALLLPIWKDIPTGMVTLTVEALDESGNALFPVGVRSFYKSAPFLSREAYPAVKRSYREAALLAYHYVLNVSHVRYFYENGSPDPTYDYNVYPSKMISALIDSMTGLARLDEASAQEALAIATRAADYLRSISFPEHYALKGLPPTYYLDFRKAGEGKTNYTADKHLDEVMTIYPASVGNAYLSLYDATREERFLKAALHIADYYAATVLPEGSWPLVLDAKTGKPKTERLCIPYGIMLFLYNAQKYNETARYAQVASGCFSYIKATCLSTYCFNGQFEDTAIFPPYYNLTHIGLSDLVHYMVENNAEEPDTAKTVEALARFIEDQFVVWGPHAKAALYDTSRWLYPACLEQYEWYRPVNGSAACVLSVFADTYKLTGNTLFLEKARALADMITRTQNDESGALATYWYDEDCAEKLEDFWFNCHTGTAKKLMDFALFEETLLNS